MYGDTSYSYSCIHIYIYIYPRLWSAGALQNTNMQIQGKLYKKGFGQSKNTYYINGNICVFSKLDIQNESGHCEQILTG